MDPSAAVKGQYLSLTPQLQSDVKFQDRTEVSAFAKNGFDAVEKKLAENLTELRC